ncbi:hypothetical protein ACSIGC_13330 [Tenacibaculum sp. ZS6-P6]|uniref:hypothetical protein n=1 Tax=Tenacibaculum sp. ZS6-P6 TaxID=3447503 RepID=UPI003F9B01D8
MSNNVQTNLIKGTSHIERLEISYTIDTTTYNITTSLNFDGLDLGSGTMTPENPNQTIWKNLGIQQFSGELNANFENSTLECKFEITEYGQVVFKDTKTIATW